VRAALAKLGRSLTVRLMLLAGLWVAATLVVGGIVLVGAFRDYVVEDFDARLEQILDHMVGASEIEAGTLRFIRPIADQRFAEPYSGWYWQVSAEEDMPAFRSRSLWDQALRPDWEKSASETRVFEQTGPAGQALRVMARDVVLPESETVYRYMVAGDTAQIQSDIGAFRRLIAGALAFLGLGLLVAVVLQVWVGLRPLTAVRTGLSRIRSGRARRLEGAFPPEIDPLVSEMNALIAHNERVLERTRTHVSNLAHALKTPITVLQGEARDDDSQLARTARNQSAIMQRQIDHHLKRARAAGGGGVGAASPVEPPLRDLVRAMEKIYAERGLSIETDIAADLVFRGEGQDLSEMVGNLMDNACKWARSRMRLSATALEAGVRPRLEIRVEDDGPGVSDADRAALFERGSRLDESKPGSGLGLAIVRDVATLAGGEIRLERSPLGGLAAVLQLPAAEG